MYTEDFFTNNIPVWNNILAHFKGAQIEAIEIGCFEGRATVWLLENILTHSQSHITCIDIFHSDEELKIFNWKEIKQRFLENTAPYQEKITLIEEASAQYLKTRTSRADFIYVDGSHLVSDVLTDAILSHLLLKQKGIIIFDDYLWYGLQKGNKYPKGAIDAFLDCFGDQYSLLSLGYQVALQKK
jgi:predicted O-methyltransferase YrrM